jgi:hypothetical protein
MTPETRIALQNYDWLMRNRRDVSLCWDSDTLTVGDGGVDMDELTRPDFTPATAAGEPSLPALVVDTLMSLDPAEECVAREMWDYDLQRRRGEVAWGRYRDAVPYARTAVSALREAGLLDPVRRLQPRRAKVRPPMPRFDSEEELANRALAVLDQHFLIEREVSGRHCSGRSLRIDAILRPRDPSGWKDRDPAFGVEFKLAHQKSFDTRDFTDWARQAIDYTHVEWMGYGRLRVFACPSPTAYLAVLGGEFLMAHLLGQLGVGELAPTDREGWALTMHGNHVLWSEKYGVRAAARWSLRPKIGGH